MQMMRDTDTQRVWRTISQPANVVRVPLRVIRGCAEETADQSISATPRLRPTCAAQPKIAMCQELPSAVVVTRDSIAVVTRSNNPEFDVYRSLGPCIAARGPGIAELGL